MKFHYESTVDAPRDLVFPFFADPRNLGVLHSADPGFRTISHSGSIEVGSITWFELNIAGILPVALGFRHEVYEPNNRFEEAMFHGPFRKFVHTHEFEDVGDQTLVTDIVEIELPWYYGGEAVMRMLVGRAVNETFVMRGQTVERLLGHGAMARDAANEGVD